MALYDPTEIASYAWTLDGSPLTLAGQNPWDVVPSDPSKLTTSLRALVVASLFSDRRAATDDVLPSDAGDPPNRGGWWGDTYSGEAAGTESASGDLFGSRLWLLRRARATMENVERAKRYAEEALAWLVEDGIAERVDVTAERIERATGRPYIGIETRLYRGKATRYAELWAEEGIA
jgi:phage gp46-like protein